MPKKIVKEIIEEQKLSQSNIKWLKKNEKLTEKQLLEEFEGYSEKSLKLYSSFKSCSY